ncbi:hypothetical protein ACOSP7_016392 [Xanthoceras sorbifolium]
MKVLRRGHGNYSHNPEYPVLEFMENNNAEKKLERVAREAKTGVAGPDKNSVTGKRPLTCDDAALPMKKLCDHGKKSGRFNLRFQFEECWASDKGCDDIVARQWVGNGTGDVVSLVLSNIDGCAWNLHSWNIAY